MDTLTLIKYLKCTALAATILCLSAVFHSCEDNGIEADPGAGQGGMAVLTSASILDVSGTDEVNLDISSTDFSSPPDGTAQVKLVLAQPVEADVTATLSIDAAYLDEYVLGHDDIYCSLFPESAVSFSSTTLVVPAGQTESEPVTLTFDMGAEGVRYKTNYLIPVSLSDIVGAEADSDGMRVNYLVSKTFYKAVKNIVYYEVNDTNPLNTLEYLLEDGTPFFDAIILFSGTINYNSTEDRVYLSGNDNIMALLKENETYLEPLRQKGIKVYLGILGNHNVAGVCQLSDWGAKQFAQAVADTVFKYKLDGVNLDDEYSSAPDTGNKWFTTKSSAAGSRLCYELKKAMRETVPWTTEVSVFRYGSFSSLVAVDGVNPGNFVDFWVGNYATSTTPASGMTYKQCSMMSIECNLGKGSVTVTSARNGKERGYGWLMWFAFDPSGTGSIGSNYARSFGYMQAAASGFYGMSMQTPTGVYHKIGSGQFDPTRYNR